MAEFCVRVNKLDGTLGMYAWVDAENEEEAKERVRDDSIMKPGWIETFGYESIEKWEAENLTEKRRVERLKNNPQLDLFSKGG